MPSISEMGRLRALPAGFQLLREGSGPRYKEGRPAPRFLPLQAPAASPAIPNLLLPKPPPPPPAPRPPALQPGGEGRLLSVMAPRHLKRYQIRLPGSNDDHDGYPERRSRIPPPRGCDTENGLVLDCVPDYAAYRIPRTVRDLKRMKAVLRSGLTGYSLPEGYTGAVFYPLDEAENELLYSMVAEPRDTVLVDYESFFNNFKYGIDEDTANSARVAEVLRYQSSKSGLTTLKEYVTRMKEGQSDIYYITGESKKAVENSPFLERLKKKGLEVLFMVDAIDEYAIGQLKEFEGKKLVSATKEGLKIDDSEEEKKRMEGSTIKFEGLCKVVKEVLGDKVEKVVVSPRLIDSPSCLVTSEDNSTVNKNNSMGVDKKTMEINPENAIMEELRKRADAGKNIKDLVMLMFETSLLTCGFSVDDASMFGARIHRMLKLSLGIKEAK